MFQQKQFGNIFININPNLVKTNNGILVIMEIGTGIGNSCLPLKGLSGSQKSMIG